LEARGEIVPADLLVPIRDPENDPTPAELEALQPHPSLVQEVELYAETNIPMT